MSVKCFSSWLKERIFNPRIPLGLFESMQGFSISRSHLFVGIFSTVVCGVVSAQVEVVLREGELPMMAMVAGSGEHALVALHGNGGTRKHFFLPKSSNLGQQLADRGFLVIGVGWSGLAGGGFSEVDAAIEYAERQGAKKISFLGFSRGGILSANYVRSRPDGTFHALIQLSSSDDQGVGHPSTRKLFVYNQYDQSAKWQGMAFERSVEPKKIIQLSGVGHQIKDLVAERPALVDELVEFLNQ